MKISIITATMNSESSILDTLHSIEQQDYPREWLEWIVVDGVSSDGTIERIRAQNFQPDRLISEPDSGIYDALNKGVGMATGDVIGFLHADDFFASTNVLTRVAGEFRNSGAAAVYGDLQYVKQSADGAFPVIRNWKSGAYNPRKLRWGWMPPHPSLYLKKEIFEQAKRTCGDYFDTSFTCSADYEFILRIFSQYPVEVVYLKMVLVKMRLGGVSNRSLAHIMTKSREDWKAIRRYRAGHLHTLVWKNISKLGQFIHNA